MKKAEYCEDRLMPYGDVQLVFDARARARWPELVRAVLRVPDGARGKAAAMELEEEYGYEVLSWRPLKAAPPAVGGSYKSEAQLCEESTHSPRGREEMHVVLPDGELWSASVRDLPAEDRLGTYRCMSTGNMDALPPRQAATLRRLRPGDCAECDAAA